LEFDIDLIAIDTCSLTLRISGKLTVTVTLPRGLPSFE
jgi:hypothetical protein